MTVFNWNENYETGHALIDAQHRMLISYVNRLEGFSRRTNPTREEFELFVRFMEFLEDYILIHFREEEDCMFRFRCPAHKETKMEHCQFLDFFREFKRRFGIEGYREDLVRALMEACIALIQRHILRIEMQLKHCQTPRDELDTTA